MSVSLQAVINEFVVKFGKSPEDIKDVVLKGFEKNGEMVFYILFVDDSYATMTVDTSKTTRN